MKLLFNATTGCGRSRMILAERKEFAMTPETAYFVMIDVHETNRFIIELSDPEKIAHARRIVSGEEKNLVHAQGTIVKKSAPYNPGWSYHLDPATIDFFEYAIEVCDAAIDYVEEHLADAGGAFLPNCHWCPWTSKLVEEVKL